MNISNKAIVNPSKDVLLNTVFHDERQSSAAVKNYLKQITIIL